MLLIWVLRFSFRPYDEIEVEVVSLLSEQLKRRRWKDQIIDYEKRTDEEITGVWYECILSYLACL